MDSSFSIREALSFGWRTLREKSGLLFSLAIIVIVLTGADIVFRLLINGNASTGRALWLGAADALAVLLLLVFSVGIARIALSLAEGKETSLRHIVPPWRLFVQYVIASILVVLMILPVAIVVSLIAAFDIRLLAHGAAFYLILIWFLLLGAAWYAYVFLRYFLLQFNAVDGARDIRSIMHKTARLTQGERWHFLLFAIVLGIFNTLGLLCFVVGLLITYPMSLMALARVYVTLREKHAAENN